jgi:hypothetical protein
VICRDIRFSERELTGTERAECKGLGEPADGGAYAVLSSVANDCCMEVRGGRISIGGILLGSTSALKPSCIPCFAAAWLVSLCGRGRRPS